MPEWATPEAPQTGDTAEYGASASNDADSDEAATECDPDEVADYGYVASDGSSSDCESMVFGAEESEGTG